MAILGGRIKVKIQNQNEKTVKIIFRGGYEEKGYKFLLDKTAPPVRYLSGELCYVVKQDVLPLLKQAKIRYDIVDN